MPRIVKNNLLVSESLPTASFQVDPAFTYAGSTSFILYDIAHAEQHHFVVPDAGKRVERLLWFQFEGYLEDNQRRYRYPSSMGTMTINELTFLHDGDVTNIDREYSERPTSDSAHAVDFLKEQGHIWEGDTIFKRMVWLDEELRNELMIIYSEDLGPTGYRPSDLMEGGPAAMQRPTLFEALQERSLTSFKVL